MKVGLVGFPGGGKTTVFNALTGLRAPVRMGGEVRLGTVSVPDPRLDILARAAGSKKTVRAEIAFCDIPGEYGGDRRVLSSRAHGRMREQEALCLVLGGFHNPALSREADPIADFVAFEEECMLADLDIVERRLDRARKERADRLEITTLGHAADHLESGSPLRIAPSDKVARRWLRGLGLVTWRPLLALLNLEESAAGAAMPAALSKRIAGAGAGGIALSAALESEIAVLDADDQALFLADLGLEEPALDRFIRAAYELLDLISFFTIAPREAHAWTVVRGTNARAAAGKVHSDMERGFIRAEVIPYKVYAEHGSERAVKEAGLLQVEGKDYVVRDGDVLHIRFNV
ncbi:MAG: DUF933 domain-containing protein [Gemmatimonadetes bacterium]|nr:DUF933 domain-containing protein [Gemmatimonadota bacterium]